jgi:hypothetical protein
MNRFLRLCLVTIIFWLPFDSPVHGDSAGPSTTPAGCLAVGSADWEGIEDASTHVAKVAVVEKSSDAPAYCKVEGYVWPQVGLEIRLPMMDWNGKLIAVGNGGWAGSIPADSCNKHLRRGYACVATDTGHRGSGAEGLWAKDNLPAQVDFAYRAIHVSTLAAKAIVGSVYTREPVRSYFMSCSTGGYQGLVEAQRFPWDFDGIIAGAPDIDEADLTMRDLWARRSVVDDDGHLIFDGPALKTLHEAALEQCDLDDGVKDGIVGNPLACRFDPRKLECKPGESKACLNAAQIQAAERIYQGPPHMAGRPNVRGALPGSELAWAVLRDFSPNYFDGFFGQMVYGASPGWGYKRFDFGRDERRLGLAEIYTATNPDLRRFKAAGGKLISYQGGTDALEMPTAMVDYYETAEKNMGGRPSTQDFFRLFIIPGMNHCTGGKGAYTIDYLSYLEAWVEKSQAPDVMIGAHMNEQFLSTRPLPAWIASQLSPDTTAEDHAIIAASQLDFPLDPSIPVDFTRPMYPYPKYARYGGTGNSNAASSFHAASPSR